MNEQLSAFDRLVETIRGLSEADQQSLLDFLENKKTPERRDNSRKNCQTPITWSTLEGSSHDFLRDLSMSGAFIKTRVPVETGEQITMVFPKSCYDTQVRVTGKVVRSESEGFAIEFETVDGDLDLLVKYLKSNTVQNS